MNIFRSEDDVKAWDLYDPASETAIRPVSNYFTLFNSGLFAQRLSPDYLESSPDTWVRPSVPSPPWETIRSGSCRRWGDERGSPPNEEKSRWITGRRLRGSSELLGLDRVPIGVAFVDGPVDGVEPVDQQVPSACAFCAWPPNGCFYAPAEAHFNCPIGAATMGFDLPVDVADELGETVRLMAGAAYLDGNEVPISLTWGGAGLGSSTARCRTCR